MSSETKIIEIGSGQPVILDKLFGPTIFANLRITADTQRNCWVIEREWIENGQFVEWCTIPNQLDLEFRRGTELEFKP